MHKSVARASLSTVYGGSGPRRPPDCRPPAGACTTALKQFPLRTSSTSWARLYLHQHLQCIAHVRSPAGCVLLFGATIWMHFQSSARRGAAALCILRCPTKTGCIRCVTYLQGDTIFTRDDVLFFPRQLDHVSGCMLSIADITLN